MPRFFALSALQAPDAEPGTLLVVVMGVATVFVVLVCLIAIIKLLGLAMGKFVGKGAAKPAPAPAAPVPAAPSDRQKLVAAIAAAVAEDMGADVSHIRIHSIRKL